MEALREMTPQEREKYLQDTPATPPPGDKTPAFLSGEPYRPNEILISVTVVLFFLALLMTIARLYSRLILSKVMKIEDYLGFASFIPLLAQTGVLFCMSKDVSTSPHLYDMSLGSLFNFEMASWIFRTSYFVFMLLATVAILIEWKHIFAPSKRGWFSIAIWIVIAFNTAGYVSAMIWMLIECRPISYTWEPWLEGGCMPRHMLNIYTACINLFVDVSIILLPQPVIWRLQLSQARKVGVAAVFSVGLVVVLCAAMRTYCNVMLMREIDNLDMGLATLLWAYGESVAMIIVFASPAIPKILSQSQSCGMLGRKARTALDNGGSKVPGASGPQPPSRLGTSGTIKGRIGTMGTTTVTTCDGAPTGGETASQRGLTRTSSSDDFIEAGYGYPMTTTKIK